MVEGPASGLELPAYGIHVVSHAAPWIDSMTFLNRNSPFSSFVPSVFIVFRPSSKLLRGFLEIFERVSGRSAASQVPGA